IHRGKPLVSHDRLGETRRRTSPPRHPSGRLPRAEQGGSMSARVFIGHRPGDAAGPATALTHELDAMFGDAQVVRMAAGAPSEERWREALAGTPGGTPILVALVTPEPPAGDGA